MLVAPLTFNTINKWAAGIKDTPARACYANLMGTPGVSILATPCVKTELRCHPTYGPSLDTLRAAGVDFITQDSILARSTDGLAAFDWKTIMTAFERHHG